MKLKFSGAHGEQPQPDPTRVPCSVSHAGGVQAWGREPGFHTHALTAAREGLPGRDAQALLALHGCQEEASGSHGLCSKEAPGPLAEGNVQRRVG